jgi:hypothetical protein
MSLIETLRSREDSRAVLDLGVQLRSCLNLVYDTNHRIEAISELHQGIADLRGLVSKSEAAVEALHSEVSGFEVRCPELTLRSKSNTRLLWLVAGEFARCGGIIPMDENSCAGYIENVIEGTIDELLAWIGRESTSSSDADSKRRVVRRSGGRRSIDRAGDQRLDRNVRASGLGPTQYARQNRRDVREVLRRLDRHRKYRKRHPSR